MPSTDTDCGRSRQRPQMNRRRFLHRSLSVGTFGLLALFGLHAGADGRGRETSERSGNYLSSQRELAG